MNKKWTFNGSTNFTSNQVFYVTGPKEAEHGPI